MRLIDPPAGWSEVRGEIEVIYPDRGQAVVAWDNDTTTWEKLDRLEKVRQ